MLGQRIKLFFLLLRISYVYSWFMCRPQFLEPHIPIASFERQGSTIEKTRTSSYLVFNEIYLLRTNMTRYDKPNKIGNYFLQKHWQWKPQRDAKPFSKFCYEGKIMFPERRGPGHNAFILKQLFSRFQCLSVLTNFQVLTENIMHC